MASNREERRLQRLRGAETHNVDNIDFGFVFPASTVPVQTSSTRGSTPAHPRSEPSQASTPPSRARPTPRSASTRRSGSKTPTQKATKDRFALNGSSPSRTPRSTRRQYATSAAETEINDEAQSAAAQDDDVTDDEPLEDDEDVRDTTPTAPVAEISESPRNAPGSGTRLFVTPGPQSELGVQPTPTQVKRGPETSVFYPRSQSRQSIPSPVLSGYRGASRAGTAFSGISGTTGISGTGTSDISEISGDTGSIDLGMGDEGYGGELEEDESLDQEMEEAQEVSDAEAAEWIGKKRPRISIDPSELSIIEEEDDDTTEISSTHSGSPIPRPVLQGGHHEGDDEQPQAKRQRTGRQLTGSQPPRTEVYITVHRLSKAPVYDKSLRDAEILNARIPMPSKIRINAVDVLGQFCEELLDAELENLEDDANSTNDRQERRELRVRARAIEAFQQELKTRLMEMAINLDNTSVLASRLADIQEKKIGLREELLAIRQEREEVALQMDEIRIKHEREMKNAEKTLHLQKTMSDIDLAVHRGREQGAQSNAASRASEKQKTVHDLELDIQTTAETLIGTAAGMQSDGAASLLQKVKVFNAFLERAAGALERGEGRVKGKGKAA